MAGTVRSSGRVASALARVAVRVLDAVLPPLCLSCRAPVGRQGELCAACWSGLHFLHPPWCARCGRPLPHEGPDAPLCAGCAARPPPWRCGRAALAYDEASRGMILRFKHADRIEAAPTFASWMAAAGAELLAEAELLVPVPVHRWRLLARGYNQAALLAKHLARLSGVPWSPDVLLRRRATRSQQGLSATARRANVTAAAFTVPARLRHRLEGRGLLLVDDVQTTGATLGACTRVLAAAGAARVDVLVLARVVKPEATLI
ncbi:MAG: ComF family protein [Geminicoccaceae bacterium]|nr:ComF family protein [Geminicoccaceae bacterium]